MKKKYFKYTVLMPIVLLSACGTLDRRVVNSTLDIPKINKSNMTPALTCVNEFLSTKNSVPPTLAIVEDFSDGTIRPRSYSDGELTDSGKEIFKHALSSTIDSKYLRVPYNDISGFNSVNDYGLSKVNPSTLAEVYRVKNIFRIKGKFTKLDKSPTFNDGRAVNLSNSNSDHGNIRFGKSKDSRNLSLTVFLATSQNTIIDSATIDITIRKTANDHTATLNISDVSGGYSYNRTVSESLHNGQQLLIEAAAYWFVSRIFPNNYSSCMYNSLSSPKNIGKRMKDWEDSTSSEKIRKIQSMLFKGDLLDKKDITSELDENTYKAIAKFEKITETSFPHNRYNLDHLYLALITSLEEK